MYQTRAQNVPFAMGGSTAQRIIRFVKANPGQSFNHKTLAREINAKGTTVRAVCRRLALQNRLIKYKEHGLCWYCAPGGSMEKYSEFLNLCKDLPYAKIHDIKLYREWPVSHRAILGIAKRLDPDSVCFNDQNQHRGSLPWHGRTLNWQLGYNIPRVKGPSITLDLDSSHKPLDFDEWISFLDFLEGLLRPVLIKEEPDEWNILSVGLNNDHPLTPTTRRLSGPVEIDLFTNFLARLYDKEIDGDWYRRDELHFSANREEAITLLQWGAMVQGGLDASSRDMTMVTTLNQLERMNRASIQSQRRMEQKFNEKINALSTAVEKLAAALEKLGRAAK